MLYIIYFFILYFVSPSRLDKGMMVEHWEQEGEGKGLDDIKKLFLAKIMKMHGYPTI